MILRMERFAALAVIFVIEFCMLLIDTKQNAVNERGGSLQKISQTGGWNEFGDDLARRTRQPLRHATYCFFFVASVVIVGGLGIWLEIVLLARSAAPDAASLKTAIATFFPALIGSTCLQILFGTYLKALRAFSIVLTLFFAAIGVWLILDRNLLTGTAVTVGTISTLVSLWFWWIANADNADFFDDDLSRAPIGGDNPSGPLDGSLAGFES